MSRLDKISLEELHYLREQTEETIPRQRVLAAIAYKQGDDASTLAERHGVVEKTIYNWLDRFDEEPIEQAPYDDPRSGRPPKLDADEWERLKLVLQQPPTELGYEQQAWSPKLLLHYVEEEFNVTYAEGYARQLLHEAGLSARTARPRNHEADPEEEAEFKKTVQKNGQSWRKKRS